MQKGRRYSRWYDRKRRAARDFESPATPFFALPFSTEYIKGDVAGEFTFSQFLKGDALLEAIASVYIKGDTALQFRLTLFVKGDVVFADTTVFIKGDTALVALQTQTIKGEVVFAFNAVVIKGDVNLVVTGALPDLGDPTAPTAPPSTKPGAISRQSLSVKAVIKDVT